MPLGGRRVISTPRHYAYLKIAEGCNNRCHYCAIPLIRGPLRSRPLDDCVAEAQLAGRGGRPGADRRCPGPHRLRRGSGASTGAVCELLDASQRQVEGLRWIRVLYAYPERVTDGFIAAMAPQRKGSALSRFAHPAHATSEILRNDEPPGRPQGDRVIRHPPGCGRPSQSDAAHHPDRRLSPARPRSSIAELCDFVRTSQV